LVVNHSKLKISLIKLQQQPMKHTARVVCMQLTYYYCTEGVKPIKPCRCLK
jgi:hypothetical protein